MGIDLSKSLFLETLELRHLIVSELEFFLESGVETRTPSLREEDEQDVHGDVLVRDDQLSLAIGRRGQNVRLASKLVGWDINVMTQESLDEQLDISIEAFSEVPKMPPELTENLVSQGFFTFDDLSVIEPDDLLEMSGLSQEDVDEIIEYADAESLRIEQEEIRAAEERKRNPGPPPEQAPPAETAKEATPAPAAETTPEATAPAAESDAPVEAEAEVDTKAEAAPEATAEPDAAPAVETPAAEAPEENEQSSGESTTPETEDAGEPAADPDPKLES